MTLDRRLTPANGRVAAAHLRGQVEAERFVEGVPARVTAPVVDLMLEPEGRRDRQLLLGAAVCVFEDRDGWVFVQAQRDGYVGWLQAGTVGDAPEPTHWVAVTAAHAYTEPDIKSPEAHWLSFGSRLVCTGHVPGFWETHDGLFVPKPHLWPVDKVFSDPVNAAQLHFGVPYLWGGNSSAGLDCSGLVQAALWAAGKDCPGDSDMQAGLGSPLNSDAPLQRGDLVFWEGHVGIMVDEQTLIHANAHNMAVAYEPLDRAIRRIEAQGDGPVTGRRRP